MTPHLPPAAPAADNPAPPDGLNGEYADLAASVKHCFKDYDIRGEAPRMLNAAFARALGQAIITALAPATVAVGRDCRLSSPMLAAALAQSLAACGARVTDIGQCGTEELYYATAARGFDLGIMVTGSHNPACENGFKLIGRGAVPVSADSGLGDVARCMCDASGAAGKRSCAAQALAGFAAPAPDCAGALAGANYRPEYLQWLLRESGVLKSGKGLRIAADAGNGCAGPLLRQLAPQLPHELICVNCAPDGSFPHGVPNPLLPERRAAAAQAVLAHGADIGAAFDGDFDRCFLFDHTGRMVESCHLAGYLAQYLLAAAPGARIVHDARVYWHLRELVIAAGGIPVMSKGGHTRMKAAMRRENALYGAEMSGHHFYRGFYYCDSGMLTFLLAIAMLAERGQSLAELADKAIAAYPASGEINFKVKDVPAVIEKIWRLYAPEASMTDRLDGISLEFAQWRFNLRASNTEPLLRLNVESRGDASLLAEKTAELAAIIQAD